jgi:class 3 adenylate cyclase
MSRLLAVRVVVVGVLAALLAMATPASAATMQRSSWPHVQPAKARLLKGRQQPVEVFRIEPASQVDA